MRMSMQHFSQEVTKSRLVVNVVEGWKTGDVTANGYGASYSWAVKMFRN